MGNNLVNIFKIDAFDSKIFKTDVYKIEFEMNLSLKLFKAELKKIEQGIIFSFVPVARGNIKAIQSENFNLVGIRNTYILRDWHKSMKRPNSSISIIEGSQLNKQIIEDSFDELMNTMKKGRRFSNDSIISKQKVKSFYSAWLRNTFLGNYADRVYVITVQGKMAGFISILIKKDRKGSIDLLCILPQFQGKGYGSLLVDRAIEYLKLEQVEIIEVVTEGENVVSNALYQKKGFLIKDVKLVYHKHFNK